MLLNDLREFQELDRPVEGVAAGPTEKATQHP
jgi:hypothetical protein